MVEGLVVRDRGLAIDLGRDAGGDPTLGEGVSEPVGVVASVSEHDLGARQVVQHERRALVVADLPLGQEKDQRPALAVADGVQLGVQAALCAPDTSGKSPF